MKKILIALMLIPLVFIFNPEIINLFIVLGLLIFIFFKSTSISSYLVIYKDTSSEYHSKLDSLYSSFEEKYKNQQVTNIGGIPFGISREEALPILRNKYGEEMYNPKKKNILSFNNIKYAGVDFNTVHFLFQSDGINSYFNTCIFVLNADTEK